jgi:hypothetical protein
VDHVAFARGASKSNLSTSMLQTVGEDVGDRVGRLVGCFVGRIVGEFVGVIVGDFVGFIVGDFVGREVGFPVGLRVGATGEPVGWDVGAAVRLGKPIGGANPPLNHSGGSSLGSRVFGSLYGPHTVTIEQRTGEPLSAPQGRQ